MCARQRDSFSIGSICWITLLLVTLSVRGAENRSNAAANFIAQQQAEERYRRLYSIVEDLQTANVTLQKRIERLEAQLHKAVKGFNDQQGDLVTTEQLDALSKKMTTELQALENRRIEDNQKILSELKKLANRPIPSPQPKPEQVENSKPTPPPYTGPVYEVTIEPGYTFDAIARKYREAGHDITAADIQRANPGVDPRKLRLGQVIKVPADE